jgi:HK97 family phage portal protein
MPMATIPNLARRLMRRMEPVPELDEELRGGALYDLPPKYSRIIDPQTGVAYGVDLLGQERSTALNRRVQRSNTDIVAVQGAVFAAVNFIAQRVMKPRVILQRRVGGGGWEELDDPSHPAALHHRMVNESLTWAKAIALVATHKLTNGNAYWVKRRTRTLNVPVEFEVWNPNNVQALRTDDQPWVPKRYMHQKPNGSSESVEPQDMVPFRGLLDPNDLLNGLSPITAVRTQLDTSMEAVRYNQRIFDHGGSTGEIYSAEEMSAVEATRQEELINRRWAGTDNQHRIRIVEGNLKPVDTRMNLRDLEFMLGQKWTVIEVARAFDLSPIALKDFDRATYSNAAEAGAQDWGRVLTELRSIIDDINVHCIWPDFGDDLRLIALGDDIPELQARRKEQAEIDKIQLEKGAATVNEIRRRDGHANVTWGDAPATAAETVGVLIRAGFDPAASLAVVGLPPIEHIGAPAVTVQAASALMESSQQAAFRAAVVTPSTQRDRELLRLERQMGRAWQGRLSNEMRGIIDHLDHAATVRAEGAIDPKAVETYDWRWDALYGERVVAELTEVFEHILIRSGFVETPMLAAHEHAATYARARGAELITNLSATTRKEIRKLVGDSIESGQSLRELKNQLRKTYVFSASRADAIARTETATSQGEATDDAARTQGRDEKMWRTARDGRVSITVCAPNEYQGWIGIDEGFQSGHMTIPGHVRCRCRILYRTAEFQE